MTSQRSHPSHTLPFLSAVSKVSYSGSSDSLSEMSQEDRDKLGSDGHQTLENIIRGFHGLGAMMFWADATEEPSADEYSASIGQLMEVMSDLAMHCIFVDNHLEHLRQIDEKDVADRHENKV